MFNISKEELEELYITKNMSQDEIADMFELGSRCPVGRLISKYIIKKPKELSNKLRNEHKINTFIEKYGVENPAVLKSVIDKIKNTKETNGTSLSSQKIREKIRDTNMKRYGVPCTLQSKPVLDKIKEINLNKYGVPHNKQSHYNPNNLKIMQSEELLRDFVSKQKYKNSVSIAEQLGCTPHHIRTLCNEYNIQLDRYKSHFEQELSEMYQTFRVGARNVIYPYELDLYDEEHKVAVEFDGDYWHSDAVVEKDYHYNKSRMCEDKGIRLIHVFEHQWEDENSREIIISIINNALGKNSNRIYARNCELRELTAKDVRDFSNKNSLFGHRNAHIYLGLFYKEELVEIMTFGHPFFLKKENIEYECIRSVTKLNTTIVGGMNKLFNYFINKFNPKSVLYYVNYNTHNGNSMNKLGFKFVSYSKGGMFNVALSKKVEEEYGKVFNRKPFKHREIKQLNLEGQVATIYDAGVKKYIWENS